MALHLRTWKKELRQTNWRTVLVFILVSFGVALVSSFFSGNILRVYRLLYLPRWTIRTFWFLAFWYLSFAALGVLCGMEYCAFLCHRGRGTGRFCVCVSLMLLFLFCWMPLLFGALCPLLSLIAICAVLFFGILALKYTFGEISKLILLLFLLWNVYLAVWNTCVIVMN